LVSLASVGLRAEGADGTVGLSVGVVEGAAEIVGNSVDGADDKVGLGEGSTGGGATGQSSCLASPRSLCQEERDQHALVSVRSTPFRMFKAGINLQRRSSQHSGH
jgi:hypothetical protein